MKVYYWSPHLSKVGTIKSVYNSCKSLRNNGIDAKIINAVGEWSHLEEDIRLDLYKKINFYKILPRGGFIKSKLASIFIFIIAFIPLLKILKNDKPKFLIIHLITSLPLILKKFFSFDTSVILRISGKINFGIIRSFLWKSMSGKIIVTSPTEETKKILVDKKIFLENQVNLLKDPILVSFNKFENNNINLKKRKRFLAVGRLTKQKNFSFLINSFSLLLKKFNDINLTIIGDDAEEKNILKKIITEKKLYNNIFLLGYKKNMESLYKDYDCFILSSLHEEPGFVLVEAASNLMPIISSDCPSGPKEILGYGKNGFLFKSNDHSDFIKKFEEFVNISEPELKDKILNLSRKVQEYTVENHSKDLNNILKKNL